MIVSDCSQNSQNIAINRGLRIISVSLHRSLRWGKKHGPSIVFLHMEAEKRFSGIDLHYNNSVIVITDNMGKILVS